MTVVPDLVAFIAARLDEDESFAHDAIDRGWLAEDNYVSDCDGGEIARFEIKSDARHAAWFNPARQRADVVSKRRILDLHGRMTITPGHPYFNDAHLTTEPMRLCKSCEPERMWRREKSWPCRTLRLLALPYAHHPDYRPEWTL